MALFFRFLVVYVTVLNNNVLIISRSNLSIAQASSSFNCLDTRMLCIVTQVQLLLTTATVI